MYGSLCDLPDGKRVIGTKWVFRNKRDEQGTIIKNKARLVAQGWMSKVHFICNITEEVPKSMFYVDDIIFGSTKSSMVKDFEDLMQKEFKMSSMGELTFFLRLQVKQTTTGKDEEGEEVDVHLYRGQSDRLSTSGGCQYLEEDCPLGQCKKQTIVAISSTEAEYVAAASCYAQNPVLHSKTKHIQIRHHFIRDCYEQRLINVVKTAHNADFYQIIDYLTGCSINYSLGKPFSADLLFDDADGVDCFPKQVIWDSLRDIGYEGNLAQLTFSKPLFSPQWKYLVHVLLHCLSPKSTSWEQFGTNIASALVGLATNQKFNFSLMIMNGMLGHIANGKPFLMYPRFIQLFLNKQLEGVTRPQNFIPSVTLPSKVFTFMRKHSPKFSFGLASFSKDAQGTPIQSAAQDSSLQGTADSQGTAEVQGTADFQGTAATQGTADLPRSPNDYTPTDASQTSGGDEGLLDLYALNREVRRLKKQTISQAKQIHKLKVKLKKLSKGVEPVVKHHAFWVQSQNLKKRRKKQRKKQRKKVSSVKLGRNKDESNLSEENNDQDDHTAFVYEDFDDTAFVTPDLERTQKETEERKSDETEEVIIEEKDTSDVKWDTENGFGKKSKYW
ncbi:putative ribonuclease H-like domain-containing protein [Tanacetum coccineum]